MIFFRVGIEESITLPEPPVDDISEAEEVKVIVANRSAEDVESIRNHDQEPYYALRKFCEEMGVQSCLSEVVARGGEGGLDLANKIKKIVDETPGTPNFYYKNSCYRLFGFYVFFILHG